MGVCMTKYIFPLVLYNKQLDPTEFHLTDFALLRHITPQEQKEYLNIESIEWGKTPDYLFEISGWIAARNIKKAAKPCSTYDPSFNHFTCSEYVIEVNLEQKVSDFVSVINLAFSLFKPTSTGLFIGFSSENNGITETHPIKVNPFAGKYDYLTLTNTDLDQVKQIYEHILAQMKDEKLYRLSELYMLAISNEVDDNIAFLLLTTCLEMLFLSNGNTQELSFRLSAYIARTLTEYNSQVQQKSAYDLFKKVKDIYSIRSKIIHTGSSGKEKNSLKESFGELVEIVRQSIFLYVTNPVAFNDLEKDLMNGKREKI